MGLSGPAQAQVRPTPGPGPQGGGGPAPGPQAAGDTFQFRVCNKSRLTLFVAVLYKLDAKTWRAAGWVEYKPNECAPVRDPFPRDDFYWYAEDGPGKVTYAGNDAQACVNPKDSFDHKITGSYSCQPGEKIAGFTKIDQKGINEGITLVD
jgi:uncharacterized membrane protein